jgi:hypothetical protein
VLTFAVFAALATIALYLRKSIRAEDEPAHADLTEDQIKQQWRKLGFFCELDDQKKLWVLTGSRAGLLYFPDLLLGYVNDPQNAVDGSKQHYGPYGSLEIMTWANAGLDAHAIRGSLDDLTRLAELVEGKLVTAEAGESITIRDEFAAQSPYGLFLDVRPDGFDPSSSDRERLGATTKPAPKPSPREPA